MNTSTFHEDDAKRPSSNTPLTRLSRKLALVAVLAVVSLVGALAANTSTAQNAAAGDTSFSTRDTIEEIQESRGGALNKIITPGFDAATWQPTESLPLPVMESPIIFKVKDDASYWFDTELYEAEKVLFTRSLGAGVGPTRISFDFDPATIETAHTATSIVWPDGAANMPFDTPGPVQGTVFSVDLIDPGLYVWNCQIHPYMIPAVVIDDPTTPGADFGQKLRWVDGKSRGSSNHEILHVVRVFFTLTGPLNWQHYPHQGEVFHDPSYPKAPIMAYNDDGSPFFIPNLDAYYQEKYNEGTVLKAPVAPTTPGIGEVFVDTQWEMSVSKTKPGSVTVYDASTWQMKHKWFVPEIDLNNPHNQWSSADGSLFFVTNWYGTSMATLDHETGKFLYETEIGPSPSHVVTRSTTGSIIIPNNGGGRVSEVSPDGKKVIKTYMTQKPGSKPALPHGHWVSGNGKYALTPNTYNETASIINMVDNVLRTPATGEGAVAAMFSGDSKRAYITNLLSSDMQCFSTEEPACPDGNGNIVESSHVDFRQNYDPVTGAQDGPKCLLPIQLPISPDDKYMIVICTGSADIIIVDMDNHRLVKNLPCGPGCHGGNFGAKKGGGWYGYVSVKYANRVLVIDGDPNGDGEADDAVIAGTLNTVATPGVHVDDEPVPGHYTLGQGGNGIEMYPSVLNGWVQTMPDKWTSQFTCQQRNPLDKALC